MREHPAGSCEVSFPEAQPKSPENEPEKGERSLPSYSDTAGGRSVSQGSLEGVAVAVLVGAAFQRQRNQPVDQLRIRHTTGGPQPRIHADGGESGQGVDLVDVNAPCLS